MEFDMKKGSPFRVNVYPKIWFWIAIGASAVCMLVKLILHPDLLTALASVAALAAGAVAGALYAKMLVRKITSKKQYLGCRTPSLVVWVLVLFCVVFTSAELSWAFLLSILMLGYSAGYFWFYLPRYIEINNEIAESRSRRPDDQKA